jgi:hypothetical protein
MQRAAQNNLHGSFSDINHKICYCPNNYNSSSLISSGSVRFLIVSLEYDNENMIIYIFTLFLIQRVLKQ